jgi:sugar lactone lactonase YvrE
MTPPRSLWFLGFLMVACEPGPASTPAGISLLHVDTLISTASGLLAQPVAMAVGGDGTLFVLDGQAAQVHRISTDGTVLPTLGGLGSGPGELRRPSTLGVKGDTLWIVDAGNGRLQVWTADGRPIRTLPMLPRIGFYMPRLAADGHILASTLGQDSCLAIAYTQAGQELGRFGTPPVDPPSLIDMSELQEEIRGGNVPGFFRNTVIPFETPNGQVWLAMLADGALWRFDSQGNPLGTTVLEEPEMEQILADFFARNQEDAPRPGVYPLMYIADVQAAGPEVWVLLNRSDEDPGVLVVFSPDGEKLRRVLLPLVRGVKSFAVDPVRQRLFLAVPSEARVLGADLGSE